MKVLLLHCEVKPFFVTIGDEGRPVATFVPDTAWLVPFHELSGLPDRVLALEIEATRQAAPVAVKEKGDADAEDEAAG